MWLLIKMSYLVYVVEDFFIRGISYFLKKERDKRIGMYINWKYGREIVKRE